MSVDILQYGGEMIGFWIKKILQHVRIQATYSEGDILRIELFYKGTVVLDKSIDIIKNY